MLAYLRLTFLLFVATFLASLATAGAFAFVCHYFFFIFLAIALATFAGILGFLALSFAAVLLVFF